MEYRNTRNQGNGRNYGNNTSYGNSPSYENGREAQNNGGYFRQPGYGANPGQPEYGANPRQEREYRPGMQSIQSPGSMPSSPPPTDVPQRGTQLLRVDAGSIRNCIYRFTYIWQANGEEYWMFPTSVSRSTVSGFRWNRRFGWGFFGVDLRQVSSFQCR